MRTAIVAGAITAALVLLALFVAGCFDLGPLRGLAAAVLRLILPRFGGGGN